MNKLLLIWCLLIGSVSFGQYHNDWIDYSQKYYSFKIAKDGMYRLDYDVLNAAGVPVASIQPENYQLFGFEKEQQILIEDGGDGTFDSGDYIVFYAKKNTTWLDSLMYEDPAEIANNFYPHYNDTIHYFLTWNNATNNERIIEETDVNFTAYTPQTHYLRQGVVEYHSTYLEGYKIAGMSYSSYDAGEGWFGPGVDASLATNYSDALVPTPQFYNGAGAPTVKVKAVSAGGSNAVQTGQGNHHLQLKYSNSNITVIDTIFSGYQLNKLEFEFPASDLAGGTTKIRHQGINDLGVAADYQYVSNIEIIYPHNLGMENSSNFKFIVPFNTVESKSRYTITNFIGTAPQAFVVSGEMKKIPLQITPSFQFLIPNQTNGQDQEVIMIDSAQISPIVNLEAVNGTGDFTNYSAMSFDDKYMIITGDVLMSGALDYKAYRESAAGGGFDVEIYNEKEINLQFAGGVLKHAMGLRHFVKFAYESATVKPNNLFIIGKGIREANENVSSQAGIKQNATSYNECIVTAYGYPASDILLTSNLSGNGLEPLIPTGRLAAKNNQDVAIYLSKMIEFEIAQDPNAIYDIPSKLWQKHILHFGGGADAQEQYQFRNYLYQYETYLEDTLFGGHVNSFFKTVSDPIDPVTLFEVNDFIADGVSLMTFFGHAAADGFDQNVDDPANWNNKGKYPITVGNACLTGNIFEPTAFSTSEEYVLIEDAGSIAFLANVKQAFSNSLHAYSSILFNKISAEGYGVSLGENVKNTIDEMEQGTTLSFGAYNVATQMTLHGDPALKVNYHEKPELEINQSTVFITPETVDLSADSIDVNVVVYNLGKAFKDTFAIELTRSFPNNGPDSVYTKYIAGVDYVDTIVFTIPFYNNIAIGVNEFEVIVDQPSVIDEQYDEIGNNQLIFQEIFDVDGIYPVWPYDFAVVPKDTITLKGSTVNPFADLGNYRFEIDTTDLFNSPEHRYAMKSSLGGVVEVAYNEWLNVGSNAADELILEDSMVYFWRVAVEDTGAYYWIESSFQHINNKTGWGQDHFFQFKNNDFLFLDYDRPSRKRLFGPAFKTIDCDVYGNATAFLETAFTLYHIDGEIAEYNFCTTNPQILVCVIDPVTLKPWGTYYDYGGGNIANPTHNFGNHNNNGGCRPRVENHFSFWQGIPTEMDAFDNMIANEIPDGHFILVYSARYADFSMWDSDNYNTFASLGADSLAITQTNDRPFILFTRKGNTAGTGTTVEAGGTKEVFGSDISEFISLADTLWGFDFYGSESSPIIGPTTAWDAMYWSLDSLETPTDDSTRMLIYGVDWAGSKTKLIDTLVNPVDSILDLDIHVDATVYPFIQLNAQQYDKTGFTPSQIDRWHVLYEDIPEAALDGSAGVYWIPGDSLYEGQEIAVAFDVKNISDIPMDSILINYWVEDANHVIYPLPYPRQDSLRVGSTIRDTIQLGSFALEGLNSLWVEVNPYVSSFEKDQIEKYHFNNKGQLPFNVIGDDQNPILDVTFNGYHILNGDIVSPTSEIIITLKDDNPYLVMDEEADTALFGIYLTSPDGLQKRLAFRNSLGEPLMEWVPADPSNLKFKIIINENLDQDGTYRLLVQGTDKSGNISGDFDYDIEFEVDHNSSITNLMNYPNPFTTSTRFVFTLTGAEVPDEFTIQIMNVSGTVVREITSDELGDIQIGRNITEFEWDGTDEFGDKLARGVYLYRVIVKMNGEDIEHRESGADQYFKKSFGKMYLL
ncbi:MAG: C25 family cysteine peptidase [Crocinitomicaceae bacterium]